MDGLIPFVCGVILGIGLYCGGAELVSAIRRFRAPPLSLCLTPGPNKLSARVVQIADVADIDVVCNQLERPVCRGDVRVHVEIAFKLTQGENRVQYAELHTMGAIFREESRVPRVVDGDSRIFAFDIPKSIATGSPWAYVVAAEQWERFSGPPFVIPFDERGAG